MDSHAHLEWVLDKLHSVDQGQTVGGCQLVDIERNKEATLNSVNNDKWL